MLAALSNLSHREFQIFCMFAEGLNANDIATDFVTQRENGGELPDTDQGKAWCHQHR